MRIPVLLSAVLFAAAAHAEWQTAGVAGIPRDVQAWRPGVFSVSTDNEARLFLADGGTQVIPGVSVGTYLAPGDCLMSLQSNNGRLVGAGPGCQPGEGSIFGDTTLRSRRMRHDASGAAFAFTQSFGGAPPTLAYTDSAAGPITNWLTTGLPEAINYEDSLGVVRHQDSHHLLLSDSSRGLFVWYDQAENAIRPIQPSASENIPAAISIDLFSGGGSEPSGLLGTMSGLYRVELSTLGSTFSAVPLPSGLNQVNGVDISTGTGSASADGFGLAVVLESSGSTVLSAVPTDNPSKVGTVWRANGTFPIPGFESAQLKQVSCYGAEYCVISLVQSDGQNLLIYRNAHAPIIQAPAELRLSEGQSTTHSIKVEDADGDAVLAAAAGFSEGPLLVTAQAVQGGVNLQFTTGNVCADTPIGRKVSLFASDGLASHERTASFPVIVRHTQPPGAPSISPEVSVVAGTGAQRLQAAPGTGCAPTSYTWTALDGGPALGQDGGATASFPTPAVSCEPLRYAYQVRAADSAGASAPSTVTVVVQPWGEPSAAFTPGSRRDVTAGQSVGVAPDALHTCQSSSGFPGVETTWRLGDGQTLPAGVRLLTTTGEEVSASSLPVKSESLTVATDDCTDATVPLTAYHQTLDASGVRGPDSEVRVEVRTRLNAVSEGTLDLLSSPELDGSRITGASRVAGLNCMERRQGLQARLRVMRQDGSEVGSPQTVSVPGAWTAEVDGCGETFRVTGRLLDEGGAEAGTADELFVTTPRVDAALGGLAEGAALMAQCGEGARGTLTQLIPAEACSAARISWAYVDGPALASTTFSGRTVDLATRETGLDNLVGQRVRVRVTADAGGGNVVTREHEVPITVAPFVDVTHETEKPAGSESGLLGVSVGLRNRTACGVSAVVLEERLEGMAYVAGSARLDGQPVEVVQEGDVLRVKGLSLGGNAMHRFTYVARPTLLGSPRMEARAFMGAVPITAGVRQVPPEAGCGCSSGSSGAAAFGLAALALLRRRRKA